MGDAVPVRFTASCTAYCPAPGCPCSVALNRVALHDLALQHNSADRAKLHEVKTHCASANVCNNGSPLLMTYCPEWILYIGRFEDILPKKALANMFQKDAPGNSIRQDARASKTLADADH